jgi:sortase A
MNSSTGSQNRFRLRWLERILLLVAIVCLGAWSWAWLDARYTQYRENRELEETLAAQSAAKPSTAADNDALETFRGRQPAPRRDPQARRPGSEGSLVGRIEIPRIGVSAIVLEGVGNKTLRRGVGHIPETALPATDGNVGLAGHRDSFFRELKDIRKDDVITLKTLDGTFQYRVEWTRVVDPEDTQVLADAGEPALTLVTCYPFYYVGSAPRRFIVRAERIEGTESAAGGS